MTEEKNEWVSDSEEEISVDEGKSSDNGSEVQGSRLLGSEARTTGGISSSEYTFDSKPVTEEPVNEHVAEEPVSESYGRTEDSEDFFESGESYEKTESFTGNKSYFQSSIAGEEDQSALKGMLSFFTIWRRDVGPQDMEAMENRFYLAPVIGALFATVIALEMVILFLLNHYVMLPSNLIVPVVVLATVLIGSKFLHFDGLVDFGDGIVASGNRDKHVRAMKDSKIGAGGFGLALVVTLGTFALYTNAFTWMAPLLFIIPVTEILIKHSMVSAAAYGTAGEGMAASQVRKADNSTMIKSLITASVLSLIGLVFSLVLFWIAGKIRPWILDVSLTYTAVALFAALVVGLITSILVGKLMANTADKTFGFTSGDVLGATNEIARPIVAFAMLLVYCVVVTLILL